MEIMGLIVIVILVALGIFFAVNLKMQQQDREIKQTYSDDQLASNFLSTFLQTDTGCSADTIEKMIQDCAIENRTSCQGKSSCQYVDYAAKKYLNQTLDVWGSKYKLNISGMKKEVVYNNSCGSKDERDSKFRLISIYQAGYRGTVIIRMDVCE